MSLDLSNKDGYFLHPGYIFVSRQPHIISTVLGSCVSVCIWDPINNFGGMNHYIHAKPFKDERTANFGAISIPYLVQSLIKLGSVRNNLKAHVVGGATNPQMTCSKIGPENIEIAEKILKENHIEIVTRDTGGQMGRKVVFQNDTGEIVIYKVNNVRKCDWHGNKSPYNR